MAAETTLSSREFRQALAVLKREQEAYMPSRAQEALFRLFNWSVFLFVLVTILDIYLIGQLGRDVNAVHIKLLTKRRVVHIAWVVLCLAVIVFFFANWGLILKLVRQARLRRQLGLKRALKDAFKAASGETLLVNVLTFIFTIIGGVIFLIGVVFTLIAAIEGDSEDYVAAFTLVSVGLSLLFLHFMRRGKQRLTVVMNLQDSLAQHKDATEVGAEASVAIPRQSYDAIAAIERAQLIDDRRQSIVKGRKEARDSAYLVQSSREILGAKSRLDLDARARLDEQILALVSNPSPPEAKRDSATGYSRIPIAQTDVDLVYQLDPEKHRIRLLSLVDAAAPGKPKT